MTAPLAHPSATTFSSRRRARIYLLESRYELLKLLRLPAFLVPTIGFPAMFYVLFGLVLPSGARNSGQVSSYLLATYGAFGVIGISLMSLGVGVAAERGQGWLAVKRASPMPLSAYFVGKYAMTVLFAAVLVALLAALGVAFGHVHLSADHWASLTGVLLLGGLPFCAMGLAVGYAAGPNSAVAVVNAVYLPMAFLSGLFIPSSMLPAMLRRISPALPPYHLGQLALKAAGVLPADGAWINAAALAGFGVLFTLFAVVAYRRDEGRTYG
ncbi:MAG: transporter permease protein [Gemmatimonadetes bacterium]|nr:transporter permease protein [Gemmatimonadota bacterium]